MNNVLVRQSVQRDGVSSYHDLDVQADEITIGSAASNAIVLQGADIAPLHLTIAPKSGRLHLKCHGKETALLNDGPVSKSQVAVGDKISIGSHIVTVLPTPPGFLFALQVDSADLESAAKHFGPAGGETTPSARVPAWVLGILTLILFLIIPLLVSQYSRSVSDEENSSSIDKLWSPGDLHPAHRMAIGNDCASCHEQLFSRAADSACLSCHVDQNDHVTPEHTSEQGFEEPRCGSCHQEHDGDRSLMSHANSRCQSCHEIASFTARHPEFEHYPATARSGILFDHDSHKKDHFGDTEKTFECSACHQLDQAGRHQITQTFEAMCIDCHGEKASSVAAKIYHHGHQIIATDPVSFFVLPRLDLKRLESENAIGAWPEGTKKGSRSGLTKLGLTPFMELLLSTDAAVAPSLGRLKAKKIKLSSLKKATESDIEDAVLVIWGVKQLLADLMRDPQSAIADRITPLLKQPMDERSLASLTAQMQGTFVEQQARQWFAAELSSLDELQEDLQNSPLLAPERKPADKKAQTPGTIVPPGSNWINTTPWSERKFSMQYLAGGHADSFIKAWLDLSLDITQDSSEQGTPAPSTSFSTLEAAQALFNELADLKKSKPGKAKGAGMCSKCHSLIADASGRQRFAWRSEQPNALLPASTRFSHIQHTGDNNADECVACHAWVEQEDFLTVSQEAVNNEHYISNFAPMNREACATCHAEDSRAGAQCLDCHSYHVTPAQAGAQASSQDSQNPSADVE